MRFTRRKIDEEAKDMTIEQLKVAKDANTEDGHVMADRTLCSLLTHLGYEEVVKAYDDIDKWYS